MFEYVSHAQSLVYDICLLSMRRYCVNKMKFWDVLAQWQWEQLILIKSWPPTVTCLQFLNGAFRGKIMNTECVIIMTGEM